MITAIIRSSLANRFVILALAFMIGVAGIWAIRETPVDAIPDLSDVQVIVRTPYPGQAPQVVENQITYPLATALLAVPGAKDVRGFSFFGDSFVYVVFEDGTDLYWARSRVLEYLARLPAACLKAAFRMFRGEGRPAPGFRPDHSEQSPIPTRPRCGSLPASRPAGRREPAWHRRHDTGSSVRPTPGGSSFRKRRSTQPHRTGVYSARHRAVHTIPPALSRKRWRKAWARSIG